MLSETLDLLMEQGVAADVDENERGRSDAPNTQASPSMISRQLMPWETIWTCRYKSSIGARQLLTMGYQVALM
jgi:hypothetical protein